MPDKPVEQLKCECVSCAECEGTGNVWYAFPGPPRGRYLGNHRSDDLDEMETCDQCRGSGVVETCENCIDQMDDD